MRQSQRFVELFRESPGWRSYALLRRDIEINHWQHIRCDTIVDCLLSCTDGHARARTPGARRKPPGISSRVTSSTKPGRLAANLQETCGGLCARKGRSPLTQSDALPFNYSLGRMLWRCLRQQVDKSLSVRRRVDCTPVHNVLGADFLPIEMLVPVIVGTNGRSV